MINPIIYKNVVRFDFNLNSLWIQIDNIVYKYIDNTCVYNHEVGNYKLNGVFTGDLMLLADISGNSFLQNKIGEKFLDQNFFGYPRHLKNIIYIHDGVNFYLYDLSQNTYIYESKIRIQYFTNDFVFVCMAYPYVEYEIDCYSIKDGNKIWSFNTKELINKGSNIDDSKYAIRSVLGLYTTNIIILLYSGTMILLDYNSGKIKSNVFHPKFYPDNFKIKTDENYFNLKFQIVEDKLINLAFNFYFEILKDDSGNYYQVAYDMREEYEKNNVDNASSPVLQTERWPVIGDFLLYGHSGDSNNKNNLVLFNYKTRKVVKSFSLEVILNTEDHSKYKHPLISRMVRNEDKIYIHYKPFGSRLYSLAIINIDELKIEDSIL